MNKKDITTEKNYQKLVNKEIPPSHIWKNCLMAFLFGGIICCVGQAVSDLGKAIWDFDTQTLSIFTTIVMVFLGATLTGLGVYDQIGKIAGAGSVVPITGFANSVVAPAMEFRREGLVMGVGAKLFILAGPVLVYGISTSILAGLLYLAFS